MAAKTLNISIGLVGHIDSGKTALARQLSTLSSTAAFDKHPQSQERGITLDLGFSAFVISKGDEGSENGGDSGRHGALFSRFPTYDRVQFTLVDCPGHASLVRTIIGGASIIDMMVLVIDVTRGMQTQSAEGLIIGEVLSDTLIVALNKCDLIPAEKREAQIAKVQAKLRKVLRGTKFPDAPIIPLAAAVAELVDTLARSVSDVHVQARTEHESQPFLYMIDHCFALKGQGTVLTGTVLAGGVKVGDCIELPLQKLQKKVKSIQVFHKPVSTAKAGDRAGICVTQLNPDLIERGLAAVSGSVRVVQGFITRVKKVRFFKGAIESGMKFHISVGHSTTTGSLLFFGDPEPADTAAGSEIATDATVPDVGAATAGGSRSSQAGSAQPPPAFSYDLEYPYADGLIDSGSQWVLVELAQPIACPARARILGSRFDFDVNTNECRIAFHGAVDVPILDMAAAKKQLKVFKMKLREGAIDRVISPTEVIGMQMFQPEVDMNRFVGHRVVRMPGGQAGTITGSFGKGKQNKFKVSFPAVSGGSSGDGGGRAGDDGGSGGGRGPARLVMRYKVFVFDRDRKFEQ